MTLRWAEPTFRRAKSELKEAILDLQTGSSPGMAFASKWRENGMSSMEGTAGTAETTTETAPSHDGSHHDHGHKDMDRAFWLDWLEPRLRLSWVPHVLVLLLGALVFLPRLGSMGLWDPWETHYGEVAREMLVRQDFVYPHWESAYFFSKPPLAMWLMALGMYIFGAENAPIGQDFGAYVEWGVRLPFAFIAIATIWAVYSLGAQLRDRMTGVLSALVLAASAQFIFIGKQSMVDMPLVGCLTIGLALFCRAVFDPDLDTPNPPRASLSLRLFSSVGLLVGTLPMYSLLIHQLDGQGRLIMGMVVMLAVAAAVGVFALASRRVCYLSGFYMLAGYAALAKGPAAIWVLAFVGIYVLFSFDLHLLWRCWLLPGAIVFFMVAAPWFVVLSLFEGRDDEGRTFVGRFWIHDTFNRLQRGVHGDRPTMGYYIEQLAYGMWPWSVLAPFAIGFAARLKETEIGRPARRLLTFILIWAVWGYVGFSLSRTGFHHYVFPAVPPLAILVGYWLRWVADAPKERLGSFVIIPVLAFFTIIARDIIVDPQHLSSLFTYKYDRAYPRDIRAFAQSFMAMVLVLGAVFILGPELLKQTIESWRFREGTKLSDLFHFLRRESYSMAMLGFFLTGMLFAGWVSHHHFNYLAQHWSQAHLFSTYFKEKKADEPIYAYQLNWRGETFYSRNTVIQVKQSGANQRMRELVDRPGREFIVVEQSRFPTLKSILSADKRPKLRILDKSSIKFYLCVVD